MRQIGNRGNVGQSPGIHKNEINHVPPGGDQINHTQPPFDPNTENLDCDVRPPTPGDQEPFTAGLDAKIEDFHITAEFIEGLRTATLEKSNMHKDDIECLCEAPSHYPDEVSDKHFLWKAAEFGGLH